MTAALQFARSLGPLDFVVWTGDNARHNRDKDFLPTSQDEILYENTQVPHTPHRTHRTHTHTHALRTHR